MAEARTSIFKRGGEGGTRRTTRANGRGKDAWIARIRWTDPNTGKIQSKERQFETKELASDFLNAQKRELEKSPSRTLEPSRKGERMTFADLIAECQTDDAGVLIPAKFDSTGYKTDGLKSFDNVKSHVEPLLAYFGHRKIRQITERDLVRYRMERLGGTITWTGKNGDERGGRSVSHTTVNRELSVMSRCWSYALKERQYITSNPFLNRKNVIQRSRENARTRILSKEEEKRLLAACDEPYTKEYTRVFTNEHTGERHETTSTVTIRPNLRQKQLRCLIILAIDSGMRSGELLKLRWKDIDFEARQIRVKGTHTKTERERYTILTARAASELRKIKGSDGADRVFSDRSMKKAFASARDRAGLADLHFHDLRRTAISRWQATGTASLGIAQKYAGHTDSLMTATVYTATAPEMHASLVEAMDRLNQQYAEQARG